MPDTRSAPPQANLQISARARQTLSAKCPSVTHLQQAAALTIHALQQNAQVSYTFNKLPLPYTRSSRMPKCHSPSTSCCPCHTRAPAECPSVTHLQQATALAIHALQQNLNDFQQQVAIHRGTVQSVCRCRDSQVLHQASHSTVRRQVLVCYSGEDEILVVRCSILHGE